MQPKDFLFLYSKVLSVTILSSTNTTRRLYYKMYEFRSFLVWLRLVLPWHNLLLLWTKLILLFPKNSADISLPESLPEPIHVLTEPGAVSPTDATTNCWIYIESGAANDNHEIEMNKNGFAAVWGLWLIWELPHILLRIYIYFCRSIQYTGL